MSCMIMLFLNVQITGSDIRPATHKVGCQPGDCTWSLDSSSGVCGYVWANILTFSPLSVAVLKRNKQ